MGVITYTAVDRGELAAGHTAGNQYQLETRFQGFPRDIVPKGLIEETLDGTPEGWLDALQIEYEVATDLVFLAERPNWREFFTSVVNGEPFQIDFTGTIANPGPAMTVWLTTRRIREEQIGGVAVQYRFNVKIYP